MHLHYHHHTRSLLPHCPSKRTRHSTTSSLLPPTPRALRRKAIMLREVCQELGNDVPVLCLVPLADDDNRKGKGNGCWKLLGELLRKKDLVMNLGRSTFVGYRPLHLAQPPCSLPAPPPPSPPPPTPPPPHLMLPHPPHKIVQPTLIPPLVTNQRRCRRYTGRSPVQRRQELCRGGWRGVLQRD